MGRPLQAPKVKSQEENAKYEEAFSKARKEFSKTWEGYTDSVVNIKKSEQEQIRALLEPYLYKVFGMEMTVGFFTDQDISDRQAIGFVPLTVAKFPRDAQNKDTWNDAIAMGMKLHNDVNGNIRWGSRGELMICVIPRNIRARNKQQDRQAAIDVENRHIGKTYTKKDKDGMEIESQVVDKGKERVPRTVRR